MADVHSKEVRSYNVSRIRSKDTKPEVLIRRFLHRNGFRYRLHGKELPGKPDIVLPKYKTVVFIHGCFWHRYEGCRYYVVPRTRTEWWLDKINRNARKDLQAEAVISSKGWRILKVWECVLKKGTVGVTLQKLSEDIKSDL